MDEIVKLKKHIQKQNDLIKLLWQSRKYIMRDLSRMAKSYNYDQQQIKDLSAQAQNRLEGNEFLNNEILKLKVENEQQRKEFNELMGHSINKYIDAQRLDWLNSSNAMMAHSRDGEVCWLVWPYGTEWDSEFGFVRQKNRYNSTREAIDAAMSGKDDGE